MLARNAEVAIRNRAHIWLSGSMMSGYIGDFAFDPQVPAGTRVQPKPIPIRPSSRPGLSEKWLSL